MSTTKTGKGVTKRRPRTKTAKRRYELKMFQENELRNILQEAAFKATNTTSPQSKSAGPCIYSSIIAAAVGAARRIEHRASELEDDYYDSEGEEEDKQKQRDILPMYTPPETSTRNSLRRHQEIDGRKTGLITAMMKNRMSRADALLQIETREQRHEQCPFKLMHTSHLLPGDVSPRILFRGSSRSGVSSLCIYFCSFCTLSIPYEWTLPVGIHDTGHVFWVRSLNNSCVCIECLHRRKKLHFTCGVLSEFSIHFADPVVRLERTSPSIGDHEKDMFLLPQRRTLRFKLPLLGVEGSTYLTIAHLPVGYAFANICLSINVPPADVGLFEQFIVLVCAFADLAPAKFTYLVLCSACVYAYDSMLLEHGFASNMDGDPLYFRRLPYAGTKLNDPSVELCHCSECI